MLVALDAERRLKVARPSGASRAIERHEAVGRAEIAIELRDLVLEDQMIAERVPGEIGQHPVVLMAIVAIVRQHQVGRRPLQRFENALMAAPSYGKWPSRNCLMMTRVRLAPFRKAAAPRRASRSRSARCREHDPGDVDGFGALKERQDQPAAADLDVVGMRAKAQELERRRRLRRDSAKSMSRPVRASRYEARFRRRRMTAPAACLVPDLPRRVAARVDVFELLAILEGVHRHPEAVVFVGGEPAFGHEALEWLTHQLFARPQVLEDLLLEDEEPAVDADRRSADVLDRR